MDNNLITVSKLDSELNFHPYHPKDHFPREIEHFDHEAIKGKSIWIFVEWITNLKINTEISSVKRSNAHEIELLFFYFSYIMVPIEHEVLKFKNLFTNYLITSIYCNWNKKGISSLKNII